MLKPILAVATTLALAAAAIPHAGLKWSIPAKGAMVTAPKTITLSFTEGVNLTGTAISILKPDSTLVEKLVVKATAGDTTVAGAVTKPLAPGNYLIRWKNVASDDGHASTGVFGFMVMAK